MRAGGSYALDREGNRILQFPIFEKGAGDYAKAMLFGKWSGDTAQDYIDRGFKGLNAKETAAYEEMRDKLGVAPQDAYEAVLSLRGFEAVKDAEGNTVQGVKEQQRLALLDNDKLTAAQKAALDKAVIVSGEDEMPADYSDRTAFLLSKYIDESRQDAARGALESGLSIDQFAQWDDRRRALENEKGADDKKVRTDAEARLLVLDEVMQDTGLTDAEKQAVADYVLISSIGEEDEKTRKNWNEIAKGKVNATDFVRFQADAAIYDKWAKGSGTDNADNVADILRGYDSLTDEQRDVLFQTYSSSMSRNPFHVSEYEKTIDQNGTFYAALTGDGKARVRSLLNEYEQHINEGRELSEWRAKAYMAEKEAGISPATYAMYRVALETANTDNKGNPRTTEATACVRAMDGLTQQQRAYLWQSTNTSWKKNPFGAATVGDYQSGEETGINPIAGAQITSDFGPRESFQTDNGAMSSSLHPSIDLAAPEGTPIGAYKSGKVVKSGWSEGGYGWVIEIEHSDGTVSAYHHMMEKSAVPVGTEVKQGETVGKVGQTGNSTGPHLDLSILRDGTPIDPATMIPEFKDKATGYVWDGSSVYTTVTSGSGKSSGGGSSGRSSGPQRPQRPKRPSRRR
ncbi:MAG: M23 family metallopeptidase [Agathobaculum desmolans]|uniref:M23 family metallopeptidase n=1 Tax=Agathobaculum desmolans TaxID=39484 RepID=UPI0039969787